MSTNLIAIIVFLSIKIVISLDLSSNIPEDGRLQFCELANKYELECVRHNVTTEDGYILGVFNIPGDTSLPLYLLHGLEDSSDTFLVRTTKSIIVFLAKLGYDIWVGNQRGNKYSRAHTYLDPDLLEFWEFSVHEMGVYDIPATIDYILDKTGQSQLQAIGHSEGTTAFFVMGSMRPEYNDKVSLLICFAPVAYLHHAESPLFPLISWTIGPLVDTPAAIVGHGEFMRNSSELDKLVRIACTEKLASYEACTEGIIYPIVGEDRKQLEKEFWPVLMGHLPSGTSLKNGAHYLQILSSKKFAQFDYGLLENEAKYGSATPPNYNLGSVTMNISLLIGLADKLSDLKDVEILRSELPNVVDYHIIEYEKWNHVDFVWGKYMDLYLFDHVKDLLETYN